VNPKVLFSPPDELERDLLAAALDDIERALTDDLGAILAFDVIGAVPLPDREATYDVLPLALAHVREPAGEVDADLRNVDFDGDLRAVEADHDHAAIRGHFDSFRS
jgi:hypothetical protein